jgi:hypothetical protein
METLFIVCAVVGGTIMVCQFALTLLGITEIDDFDTPEVHADSDVSAAEAHGDAAVEPTHHHGEHRLLGVISFRTLVAAATFFGLSGLAARSAGLQPAWVPFVIALAAGWGAMYGVHFLMKTLYKMRSEGTAHIEYAVGKTGSVYLRIPANRGGAGKVSLTLQNRTMEYQAVTAGDAIPTGASVVVIGVLDPETVEVEPVRDAAHIVVEPQAGQILA